jgi:polyribonucleotide 5'-hydroxyl-kinase
VIFKSIELAQVGVNSSELGYCLRNLPENMAPSDVLPVGATRVVSEMQPALVDPALPGSGLLNCVLALLAPPNPDENERYDEEILDLTVVGFLIV